MAAVTICSDFEAQEQKISHCFHCFPIYLPWNDGTRCHDLSFFMLSFKPVFFFFNLSSLMLLKGFFNSCSLSAIRVASSAYLRLLIFLLAILIPSCNSSRSAFCMMYSAYVKVWKWKSQLCPTLCDPMDYTVCGILQARILEWVALPFSRGSSQLRDWTQVFCVAVRFFTSWATREAQEYWSG